MPLLRTEKVHGVQCKFYDGDVVKVGTTAARFTIKVPADEASWFSTRLRTELIKRKLAEAAELPVDEAGEAAMAAKAAEVAKAAERRAASKEAAAAASSPRKKAAAALEQAMSHAQLAEKQYEVAEVQAKVARVWKAASTLRWPRRLQRLCKRWTRSCSEGHRPRRCEPSPPSPGVFQHHPLHVRQPERTPQPNKVV